MPALFIFLTYLCAVLLLTALVYFPVYQVLQAVWEIRPDRLFYRLAMIIAILGFWPFLMRLGINHGHMLGYTPGLKRFIQTLSKGLAIGVLIMAVHTIVLLLCGARVPHAAGSHLDDVMSVLLSGLLTGLLVAFIEESFFRGAMQYQLRRSHNFVSTALITSLLYAAVHFIHPPAPPAGTAIDWLSGLDMLAGMLHQYADFTGFIDSFIALFTAGLLLSLVRERSGNIALCIGIHAGWVLTIKLVREMTLVVPEASSAFLIGQYDNVIGWAAAGMLGLVTLSYWKFGNKS